MKKILLTLIISASLYVFSPLISSAALLMISPSSSACTTTACKNAAAETARLNQEKIDAQKKADQIAAQNAARSI